MSGAEASADVLLSDDQHFLVNFIMSNYLGPDVYSDYPRCSASQRLARGLPPYTLKNLGSSFLSVSQLESLYYYVLRNAESNLLLKPNMFRMYLKGSLPLLKSDSPRDNRQFTSFFPLNVHEHKRYSTSHEIVKAIVVIDEPAVSCINKEDLQKFRRYSHLEDLKIDRNKSLSHQRVHWESQEEEQKRPKNKEVTPIGHSSDLNSISSAGLQATFQSKSEENIAVHVSSGTPKTSERILETYKRRRCSSSSQKAMTPHLNASSSKTNGNSEIPLQGDKTGQPAILPLLAVPNKEDCNANASISLTGTASKGTPGPPVGVVDIGVSKVAYFFQVALPGIRRDCEFSCEIESDGKVILQGSTSGGKTVKRRSRVFEMNFRQICPAGPFTVAFRLPGPVDPRLFSPNFRSDGIFEAVIIRHEDEGKDLCK